MKIHEKIRSIRESNNLSQEEMADKLNMSVNGYSKIERGKTKTYIPKLEQIAKVFDVHLFELMADDRNVYLITDNSNHGCNVIGSSAEIGFEIQKLHMTINHKDETIEQLRTEISLLKDVIELMKR